MQYLSVSFQINTRKKHAEHPKKPMAVGLGASKQPWLHKLAKVEMRF